MNFGQELQLLVIGVLLGLVTTTVGAIINHQLETRRYDKKLADERDNLQKQLKFAEVSYSKQVQDGQLLNLRQAIREGIRLDADDVLVAIRHKISLRYANLAGINLKANDLTDIDFVGANLHGADLSESILVRADLSHSNLQDANLRGVDMFDAKLREANLSGAKLMQADLTGAISHKSELGTYSGLLYNADLTGAIFDNADLTEARIDKRQLARAKSFNDVKLPPLI